MTKVYYRVHWDDENTPPFAPENAWSAPWGERICPACAGTGQVEYVDWDWSVPGGRVVARWHETCEECQGTGQGKLQRGYSCCSSPEALVAYFEHRGGCPDDMPVVIFAGKEVGLGPDGEPLVVPRMVRPRPRWTTYGRVKEIVHRRERPRRVHWGY